MNTIKTLCDGQSRATRRRILAAYYRGVADALKVPRGTLKTDIPLLRKQAE